MGFGSYVGNGHGGGGSSNLSALAPPFTVDRSIPKPAATPLVDLGEGLNWVDTNPYAFNSPPSAQFPQLDLDPIPSPSYNQSSDLFEPKTYFPSYVSTPVHVSTFNEQSLSGLDHAAPWGGGLWGWEKGKPAQLDGSFYANETNVAPSSIYTDHMNLGAHPSKSLNTPEETSHNIYSLGREKQAGPANIENLDYNPVLGQNPSFTPGDYLKTSVIGSSSVFTETNLQAPPLNVVNCKKSQVPFSTPYEKPLRQHGTTPSDSIPAMKSSPGIVIRPPAVGTGSSGSNTVSLKNVNPGNNASDANLTGTNLPIPKEAHSLLNFGGKSKYDPSQLSFHLNGSGYLSGESSSTSAEKLATTNMATMDTSDHLFRAKSGNTFSRIGTDNFSLALDNNEAFAAVESSLENLDHYNPPVDSPCWKGAPASHNSPFGSSQPVALHLAKKHEASDSLSQALKFIPMNTANMVKHPSGKHSETLISDKNGNVEDGSISSLKLPSVTIPYFTMHQPDNAGQAGSYQKKANCTHEIKFSDDATEVKKDYVLFDKSVDEVEKASHTSQFISSATGVADIKMKNNNDPGWGNSHSFLSAPKIFSLSPSFVEDVSSKHTILLGRDSVSNSSISVLVDTMHNLSELLLHHCSSEACELKDQDLKSLEQVINNLGTCMSKSIGQESLLSGLHKGTTIGKPQVAAIDVLSQHIPEKKKHSGKKDEKCAESVSVKSGTDIKAKNDKMTQAIKKVLIENFHEKEESDPQVLLYKNLWLEAEAALCSINYMARYNNMKIEIEKRTLDLEKDLSEDTPGEAKISKSISSAEINVDKKLTTGAESASTSDVSNQSCPIASSGNHADDVTARFHVLKCRLDNSNSAYGSDVDELSSSKPSLDSDEVDKLATEVKDSTTPGPRKHDSPALGTACHTDDFEASVLARFAILKNRGTDDVDSNDTEQKRFPEAVGLGLTGKIKQISIDEDTAEDGISGVTLGSFSQRQVSNHAGEEAVMKEFHPCVKHDCRIQSPRSTRLGNQLSAGWYDSCSSDWEHSVHSQLQIGFYRNKCNLVEFIVKEEVRKAFIKDRGVAAGLMRMHFHDCFIRGCDASVLLDSTPSNTAEKDSFANNPSLRGYEVIDNAKARLEAVCKGVVSCADIIAFAARDSIEMTGGLGYDVPAGRRDGRVSIASEIIGNLPPPTFNVDQLTQMFANKGFTQEEMVTLAGGHTIGRTHCTSLTDRLYNFSGTNMQDPNLDPKYAEMLKRQCPQGSTNPNLVVPLNPSSPTITDSGYYIDVLANKGMFASDHALLTNSATANQVSENARNPMLWKAKFAAAMVKMGHMDVKTGTAGEIRANCRVING
ncbi:Plant peroxidase [Corchorus capsularis]|uniref:peroxidase n=1 Tax=Corchorus capsularis TaxID=210143 RepID=A0A1R3JK24_COCAP|nr:Plant peroxidase [Corchorus capsularis]